MMTPNRMKFGHVFPQAWTYVLLLTSLQLGSNWKGKAGDVGGHTEVEVGTQLQCHAQSSVVDSSPAKLDDIFQKTEALNMSHDE